MQTVNVETSKLLDAVVKNRETHINDHKKALEDYRTLSVKALTKMLKDAKSGAKIQVHTGLTEPQSHVGDYDRVISMLKMSVDPTVLLVASEFDQYVNDNWSWGQQFKTLTTQYAMAASSR